MSGMSASHRMHSDVRALNSNLSSCYDLQGLPRGLHKGGPQIPFGNVLRSNFQVAIVGGAEKMNTFLGLCSHGLTFYG